MITECSFRFQLSKVQEKALSCGPDNRFSFFLRSFSLTVCGADVGCWHPSFLPGAGSWTGHPTGQHRSVAVHLPQASWHWLLQLCGKKLCEHFISIKI